MVQNLEPLGHLALHHLQVDLSDLETLVALQNLELLK
jgi:hypothetical protein